MLLTEASLSNRAIGVNLTGKNAFSETKSNHCTLNPIQTAQEKNAAGFVQVEALSELQQSE